MPALTPLLHALDEAHREFAIALGGLPDEDLWKRPHPRLLSVGELAAHVVYGEAVWVFGDGTHKPDLSSLAIQSPLLVPAVSYYPYTVDQPVILQLGTEAVAAEVMRIHQAARPGLEGKQMEEPYPGQWGTWGYMAQYQAFHVAYHTGQAYSVRHLLGHDTEDN